MTETIGQEPEDEFEPIRQRVLEERDRQNLTNAAIGRAAGVKDANLSEWLNRKYKGIQANVANPLKRWLQTLEDKGEPVAGQVLKPPGYLNLPTAIEMTNALAYAQTLPGMALIIVGSGIGKTTVMRRFMATRSNVHRVAMRPKTAGVHNMLMEIALALGLTERDPAKLDRAIGESLQRGDRETLLIVDEAQVLEDASINQLRWFLDEYDCGLALSGNEGLYKRFTKGKIKEGEGQIQSRIGLRVRRLAPQEEDVLGFIRGWGVTDPEQIAILSSIARGAGALRLINETLRLASRLAANQRRSVTTADINAAWVNRYSEVV